MHDQPVPMTTEIAIDGVEFLINGAPTYPGVVHQGRRIQGLLFNSRMVQAIFDDENPGTVDRWRYPDTGVWDPDRNTDELCAMLPEYRRYGLLGVTVGLQGGGAIYTPDVYPHYINRPSRLRGASSRPTVTVWHACLRSPTLRAWSSSSTSSTGARRRR